MKLVFATHNKNKFKEVKAMLPRHIELLSLTDIGCDEEIEETADSIEGNAKLKAKYVREKYNMDCFADDTGLEVKALNGEPGVFSGRYAGPENDSEANIKKLLQNLKSEEDRSARFKTAIALSMVGKELVFVGICDGIITESSRGEAGFGYDSVFQPKEFKKTFAEMTEVEKGDIGHRGQAMRELIAFLEKEISFRS